MIVHLPGTLLTATVQDIHVEMLAFLIFDLVDILDFAGQVT